MILLHLLTCIAAIVALAHILAGRIPDCLFVFLPCVFFVPDLFYMELQWGTVPDWLMAGAAALTAFAAWRGVDVWRRQMLGQDRIATAKRLLAHVYKIQRLMDQLREPRDAPPRVREELIATANQTDSVFIDGKLFWSDFKPDIKRLHQLIEELLHAKEQYGYTADPAMAPDIKNEIETKYKSVAYRMTDDPLMDEFGLKLNKTIASFDAVLIRELQ